MKCMVVSKMLNKIIDVIEEKHLIKRYGYLILALFISAICYNLLIYPAKIVSGGANGLSIVVETAFGIPPATFILVFSTIILILSFLILEVEKSSGSVISTFVYPVFVELTSGITTIIDINNNDMLLISLFVGIINGWTSGIIYKMGFSNGGISLINQMLFEKLHFPLSKSTFFINMIIVVLGGIFYGVETILYAIIVLFISGIIIDRVLLGISNNKIFYIITTKEEEVKEYLLNEIGHGVTKFDVVKGYLNSKSQALMTVIPTKEYFKVSEGIKQIDKNAFFVVTDSYQMSNGA